MFKRIYFFSSVKYVGDGSNGHSRYDGMLQYTSFFSNPLKACDAARALAKDRLSQQPGEDQNVSLITFNRI